MKHTLIVTLNSGFRSIQHFEDAREAMKAFNCYKISKNCSRAMLHTMENGVIKVIGYKKKGAAL